MDGLEHTADINTESTENTNTTLQVSDAIERLLANPELLSTVASAIGAKAPTVAKDTSKDTTEAVINEHPEEKYNDTSTDISAKLPEIMSTVAPVIASLSGKGGSGSKLPDDNRTRLLCALKPYVNPHRREAIETMVQLARISEIIKTVK